MKKLILLILTLFLFSCSNQSSQTNTGTINIIDKQGEYCLQGLCVPTYSGDIVKEEKKPEVPEKNTQTGLTIKLGKYCLLDMCIPENTEFTQSGGYYILENYSEGEETNIYKLSMKGDYFEKYTDEMMNNTQIKITKIGNNYIKQIINGGCGGYSLDQKVYDNLGNEVNDYILSEFKKDIKIGNIIYKPALIGTGEINSHNKTIDNLKIFKNDNGEYKIFKTSDDFQNFIEKQVLDSKQIYKYYVVSYEKYKNFFVIYNSEKYDGSALRIVSLGIDENYLSKNINKKGELLDLDVTNKIIGYYSEGEGFGFGIFDQDGNDIDEINQSKMPFFRVEKLNDKGNYLVYFNDDSYKLQSLAEMCKPVVYYYSKQKTQNSLSIGLGTGDYFTKTIPNFTSKNTWDFESENGKVKVENKNYDYLYYSLVKVGYESNKDGWIVLGKDIVRFFEDKLEKINFNTKEKKDFIDYWKNEFESNKYYFVSFKYTDEMNKLVKLNFKNQPENEFRVLLDSYVLGNTLPKDKEKYLYKTGEKDPKNKYLIKRFERNKTQDEVFEWGGVLKKEDKTVVY